MTNDLVLHLDKSANDFRVIDRHNNFHVFDKNRIIGAIAKCFEGYSHQSKYSPQTLAYHVLMQLTLPEDKYIWHIEEIQNAVENTLEACGEFEAKKRYAAYRTRHALERGLRSVPSAIKAKFDADKKYFPTILQQFQFYDKYSRFNYALDRRETWEETVDRAVSELRSISRNMLPNEVYQEIREAILAMEVMPSMRLLAMAGKGLPDICFYNCSANAAEALYAFVEALIISMCGCGVGFSVESKHIEDLPSIKRQKPRNYQEILTIISKLEGLYNGNDEKRDSLKWSQYRAIPSEEGSKTYKVEIIVGDTQWGWAESLSSAVQLLWAGYDFSLDVRYVREHGTPLKTKGGTASGPEPLVNTLSKLREIVLARSGKRLTSFDAHRIMCLVGNAAVSGGVRRTAMLSLFDFDDEVMLKCKTGNFEEKYPELWNSNNSAVMPENLTEQEFMRFMLTLYEGGRGEPGIFNRPGLLKHMPQRRLDLNDEDSPLEEVETNPCGEIELRKSQFCNLSAVIARAWDTMESLKKKIRVATVIGTIQSMATRDFYGLRPIWKKNCEKERLLGVDITGQMDAPHLFTPENLAELKSLAIEVNAEYADALGIAQSASITCNKPSGNTSQFVNCSSGIHARFAPYYFRHVRVGAKSTSFHILRKAGVPMFPENGETELPEHEVRTWVARFPIKSPEGAVTLEGYNIEKQFNTWLNNKKHWTEHNPSVTLNYEPNELLTLAKLLWDNWDYVGGIAMLPKFNNSYRLLPYVAITKEEYEEAMQTFPAEADFSEYYKREQTDLTTHAQEFACQAGICDYNYAPEVQTA